MQILENSMLGLRAARLMFRSPDSGVAVTLFPVVHVGEASFFRIVYDDAFSHDVVLTEGVDSPVVRHITRSYRWIDLARLGLVLQPRHPAEARPSARIVHADLSADEFHAQWRQVQLWLRLVIWVFAPLVGIQRRLFASRRSLAEKMTLDDRRSSEEILSWDPAYAALNHSFLGARDARLIQCLGVELERPRPGRRIAVVYGAMHIRAVLAELTKRGFRSVESSWLTIFSL